MKISRYVAPYIVLMILLIFWFVIARAPIGAAGQVGSSRPYVKIEHSGVISGTIRFIGRPPVPRRIDMSADMVCVHNNRRSFLHDMQIRSGRLANVFVYIKSGPPLDNLTFPAPSTPVTLDQHGCEFRPRVLGLQVGQRLRVTNSDPTTHNVHTVPRKNPDWNQSQSPGAEPLSIQFAVPEVMVPIKCNQHPWMKALVGVLPHPFFAVTDVYGNFRIEGVPAGRYSVAAWHERFGEKVSDLDVNSGLVSLDFEFAAKDYPNIIELRRRR